MITYLCRGLLIAGIALLSKEVLCESFLVPEPPYLSSINEYSISLRAAFNEGFSDDVELRVFIDNPFDVEEMVGIRKIGQRFSIFDLRPEFSIKHGRMDSEGKVQLFDVKTAVVRRAEKEVSADIAKSILEVLKQEILMAKYDFKPHLTVDSSLYSYSVKIEPFKWVGARSTFVERGSRVAIMAGLASEMAGYAKGEGNDLVIKKHVQMLKARTK